MSRLLNNFIEVRIGIYYSERVSSLPVEVDRFIWKQGGKAGRQKAARGERRAARLPRDKPLDSPVAWNPFTIHTQHDFPTFKVQGFPKIN